MLTEQVSILTYGRWHVAEPLSYHQADSGRVGLKQASADVVVLRICPPPIHKLV
jgi:hypothetical protein